MEITQEKLSEELKQKIYNGFKEHAIQKVGIDAFGDDIAFIARENDEVAGAVSVRAFWGALHIKYMWIKDGYRRKGLGKKLMEIALAFGVKNGYSYSFVETMSFQAPLFYQKLGFKVDFKRSGLSHNVEFYYLSKKLN